MRPVARRPGRKELSWTCAVAHSREFGKVSVQPHPMTAPFEISAIDHVVLRVRDVPTMLAFYQQVIGCLLEREQRDLGLYQLRCGGSLIDLVSVDGKLGALGGAPPGTEGRNLDHFAIGIRPFDDAAIRRHLADHGVEVIDSGQRYGAGGMGPSIYIRDPEGNVVELKG